ncbi:hypothetical protein [Parapedobacter tibetensis]|uniref:hypothetical protein n=1 Tax=Parapedobacter tibetensis TaxID=2972951 RepID=UPI00214DB160|nr:hypothetical protein [Parapedobacter tibetensis]
MAPKQENTRRAFIQQLVTSGFYVATGGIFIAGCGNATNKKKEKEEELSDRFGGDCGDYSKLTKDDFKIRKQLGYEEKSPMEDTQCQLCNLWLPPKKGQTCGGCTLFKGPIEPEGTCTYWAPRQQ